MDARSLACLTDAELLLSYECVRTQPLNRDFRTLQRAFEHRVCSNGGQLMHERARILYVWERSTESLVRTKFGKDGVKAKIKLVGRVCQAVTPERASRRSKHE